MLSIETVQSHIGGVRKGRCLNTTAFPPDLRCLTYITMFNLYPIRKMTTINNARAIFLMEFRENIYIDISAYAFSIIADATRTTSRPKLILPSLIMRILHKKSVETPQDISLMPIPPAINALTITGSNVCLSDDEEKVDPKQEQPMDTETEAEGQPSSSRRGGGRERSRASPSSVVPPNVFQIILERIDGLKEVQTEHSNRPFKTKSTCSQPSLIASRTSLGPLAIPIKKV